MTHTGAIMSRRSILLLLVLAPMALGLVTFAVLEPSPPAGPPSNPPEQTEKVAPAQNDSPEVYGPARFA